MYRLYDLRESCPVASTLTFSLQKPAANKKAFALSGWLMTLLVLGIMFAVIGYAMYGEYGKARYRMNCTDA